MNVGDESKPSISRPTVAVQRGIRRPPQLENPLVGKPIAGGIEQPVGHFLVVDRLEEAEESAAVVVAIDVSLVQNGADAADDFTPTIGQKCLDLVPIIERIVGIADIFLLVEAERGNPVRVFLIYCPGKLEKLLSLPGIRNSLDDNTVHNGLSVINV